MEDSQILNGIKFTQTETQAARRAYLDYLTGLPNRRYLENQLRKEVLLAKGNKTSFALLLIDLDEFKYVNNSFGYSVGDKLLEDFSARLQEAYLQDDAILCRLGGDEFIILLPNVFSLEEINKHAGNLITLINDKPFNVSGNDFFITISAGVSVYPYSGESIDLLLKNADLAMYRAKSNGKNQYQIFSPTMNLFTYKQFTLRNDLKKALINNEFAIFYQPRFTPLTNELIGAEALIRWNHPGWGLVSPDEFISMAEESGLIVPIGAWMLKNVCQQLKNWQMDGLPIKKVSLNLSSLELLQSNFIEMVSSVLKENYLEPKWIEFEITERMIMDREENALKTLTSLKTLGISLALDDFGTGYSSINYLWKLPCDIIKIDKSLIKEMQDINASYEVVAAIIALCKKLKKKVVAEGVETHEQLELLQRLACEEIQGYLFSRPVSAQKFAQYLKQGKWVAENTLITP